MRKPRTSIVTRMAEEYRAPILRALSEDTADQAIYKIADKIMGESVPGSVTYQYAAFIKLLSTMVKEPTDAVALLLKKDGGIASVYADPATANAKAKRYNAHPVVESTGDPDEDAPYTVKVWGLIDVDPMRVK